MSQYLGWTSPERFPEGCPWCGNARDRWGRIRLEHRHWCPTRPANVASRLCVCGGRKVRGQMLCGACQRWRSANLPPARPKPSPEAEQRKVDAERRGGFDPDADYWTEDPLDGLEPGRSIHLDRED